MARVKTFVNGGNLLPSDLDTIQDDYECAFGTYKHLREASMRLDAPTAGTYVFAPGYAGAGLAASGATAAMGVMALDPALYWSDAATESANPRGVYYHLGLALVSNNTAVGTVTITAGLYAVASTAGTGAAEDGITLGGAPITGSTVTITNPAASSLLGPDYSGDFAAPSTGLYAVAVVVSANAAANSSVTLVATLRMRQK